MALADFKSKPEIQAEAYEPAQAHPKLSSKGITLVPQPSDDIKDPLVSSRHFFHRTCVYYTIFTNLSYLIELVSLEEVHYPVYLLYWIFRHYGFRPRKRSWLFCPSQGLS